MDPMFEAHMNIIMQSQKKENESEEAEMIKEAKFQLEFEKATKRKRFLRKLYYKFLRLFRRKKAKPVIDKSQFYELERLQMENFPSVREYEMALAEFQRTRCE